MMALEARRRRAPSGDTLAARDAARRAGAEWASRSPRARAEVLTRAARELAVAPWLVHTVARVSDRAAHEVWSAELLPTVDALRWLAGAGRSALRPRRLPGSTLQWYVWPARHELRWDPYGVIGIVSPGNSLLYLPASQVAAALLGGNAVLWKPAPVGTAIALAVLSVFARGGLPAGVLQVLPGDVEAARAIVRAGVDKLFFTGGARAGRALYRLQADTGRPAALELSGPHCALVLTDAPVAPTAQALVWGKLANGGRNCVSVQLVLVERPLMATLIAAIADAMATAVSGGAGRLSHAERIRLEPFVGDAIARGARLAYVGPEGGLPAVLTEVAPGMRVVDEEVQGPILAIAAVDGAEEVGAAWINGSPARLSASVWSADVPRARRLAARLDVGQVWINDTLHFTAQPAVPLAGRGASGFGASRGLSGLLEMVQPKVVSVMPRWAPRFHHRAPTPATEGLFAATARLAIVAGLRARVRAWGALLRALAIASRRRA
jgi:acyl-CoA reductase-like NAD-dependent aldehyde dehydrogenase